MVGVGETEQATSASECFIYLCRLIVVPVGDRYFRRTIIFYVCPPVVGETTANEALALKWLPAPLEPSGTSVGVASSASPLPSPFPLLTCLESPWHGVTSRGIEGHEKGLRFPVVHRRRLKSSSLLFFFFFFLPFGRILFLPVLSEKFTSEHRMERMDATGGAALFSIPGFVVGSRFCRQDPTRL